MSAEGVCVRRGVVIGVVSMGVIAAGAPPANGASTRAEYGQQADSICATANPQLDQLAAAFDQARRRLLGHKVSDRKFAKLNRRIERLEIQMRVQFSAIFHSELDQLRQVAPAPGDEALVADWIATRESLLGIWDQNTEIIKRILRLNQLSAKGRISLRAFIRAGNRISKQATRLLNQYLTLGGKDYDLGTQLGATPCVSLDFPSALV
jgi:hypothetical protein